MLSRQKISNMGQHRNKSVISGTLHNFFPQSWAFNYFQQLILYTLILFQTEMDLLNRLQKKCSGINQFISTLANVRYFWQEDIRVRLPITYYVYYMYICVYISAELYKGCDEMVAAVKLVSAAVIEVPILSFTYYI